jgi:hypothetical protein
MSDSPDVFASKPVDEHPPNPPNPPEEVSQPEDEPVNLGRIMDDLIEHYLRRYLGLGDHVPELFCLYGVMTHCLDIATHAPRLFLRSATPRCGKTTCIKILSQFVRQPEIVSEVSRAALLHTIAETGSTVMCDEADESIAGHKPLFGILHSGHDKEGAHIKQMYRGENTRFSTFAFIIFGSIGNLHPQIMDRSVIVDMQRDNEARPKFRPERAEELREMRLKFSQWAEANSEFLASYDPSMPDLRNDRAEDNWRLMIGIADLAAGEWPHRARAAAVHFSRGAEPEVSEPEALIHDIKEVWGGTPDRIRSTELVAKLRDMEGRPWSTLNPDRMAKLLRNFPDGRGGRIKSNQLRFGHGTSADNWHGYESWQFENANSRYPKPVAGVAPVAPETTWPSLDEIAAAVQAVRDELGIAKAARAGFASESPATGATGATEATPAEPVAPGPVVEPKPSGVTPEMHAKIMESMAEKDPESYAELMKEAQAKAATSPLRADAGGTSAAAPATPEPAAPRAEGTMGVEPGELPGMATADAHIRSLNEEHCKRGRGRPKGSRSKLSDRRKKRELVMNQGGAWYVAGRNNATHWHRWEERLDGDMWRSIPDSDTYEPIGQRPEEAEASSQNDESPPLAEAAE